MSKVIETTVYTFEELSERAKERARDWYRGGMDASDFDCTLEDAVTIANILGITIHACTVKLYGGGTRTEPQFFYSVGGCYDYCAFNGSYSYAKGSCAAIREYAPTDSELHGIADRLRKVQAKYFYRLSASITSGRNNNHVSTDTEYNGYDYRNVKDTDAETIEECIRDFAAWIYDRLTAEYEYQNADEQVDESILANKYTFDADGNREG